MLRGELGLGRNNRQPTSSSDVFEYHLYTYLQYNILHVRHRLHRTIVSVGRYNNIFTDILKNTARFVCRYLPILIYTDIGTVKKDQKRQRKNDRDDDKRKEKLKPADDGMTLQWNMSELTNSKCWRGWEKTRGARHRFFIIPRTSTKHKKKNKQTKMDCDGTRN